MFYLEKINNNFPNSNQDTLTISNYEISKFVIIGFRLKLTSFFLLKVKK